MENRAFSDPAFKTFASKVVLYLNCMTRIDGHPHDNLLIEKGYRGHPTLAFMSAEGTVLGRPRQRSVASFDETLAAIDKYAELHDRQSAGETGLDYDFFVTEYKLMRIRGKKLVERAKALEGLNKEQQLSVDRIAIMVEVDDLVLKSMCGGDALIPLGKRMIEIFNDGRFSNAEQSANAWSVVVRYGTHVNDADVLERGAQGLRRNFPDDEAMLRWATSLEESVQELRAAKKTNTEDKSP